MIGGAILFLASAALFAAAILTPSASWTMPLATGAVAALVAGVYQGWWLRSLFERPRHVRVVRRHRAH